MGCGRALVCVIFPPAAVLDRGAGNIILVSVLTLCLWVPGMIAALMINQNAVATKKIQKQLANQHNEDMKMQQQLYNQQRQQAQQYYNQQQQYPQQQPPMPPQEPPKK